MIGLFAILSHITMANECIISSTVISLKFHSNIKLIACSVTHKLAVSHRIEANDIVIWFHLVSQRILCAGFFSIFLIIFVFNLLIGHQTIFSTPKKAILSIYSLVFLYGSSPLPIGSPFIKLCIAVLEIWNHIHSIIKCNDFSAYFHSLTSLIILAVFTPHLKFKHNLPIFSAHLSNLVALNIFLVKLPSFTNAKPKRAVPAHAVIPAIAADIAQIITSSASCASIFPVKISFVWSVKSRRHLVP